MKKAGIIEGAVHYHKIVLLIVGILVLIGMYGLYKMPKQEFPTFTIRQGAVIAVYPGATSYELEERVTKPLEDFIFSYKEINKKKTYSQSQDGVVIVLIELNDNIKDKDAFWAKFKHGLAAFKTQLPSGVIALQAKDDVGDTSSILITLESEQKTYRELEKYLEELKNRLRRIDAVSNLRSFGLQNEQITVYLDQNKMAQYGIGSFSLLANLFAQGFTTMSGNIDNSRLVAPIHVADSYNREYEVGEQIVYSDPKGHIIRLKDIARIVREYPDMDSYIKNNGKTIAILGSGIDNCYPKENINLYNEIKSNHLLLSEYPFNRLATRQNLMFRSRLISGLSKTVVLTEVEIKSPKVVTAGYALEQSKDIYCVPTSIDNEKNGCNDLIKNGANVYEKIDDLFI